MIVVFASINDTQHHRGTVYTSCVTRQGKQNNLDIFTPTSVLVYGYKHFTGDTRFTSYRPLDSRQYTIQYAALLKVRSTEIRAWIDQLTQDTTICCFCRTGTFCHRRLLATWFKSYKPDLQIELY